MMRSARWFVILSPAAAIGILAFLGNIWLGLNFWIAIAIAILALVANGWVATFEDEAPGGFNNPTFLEKKSKDH